MLMINESHHNDKTAMADTFCLLTWVGFVWKPNFSQDRIVLIIYNNLSSYLYTCIICTNTHIVHVYISIHRYIHSHTENTFAFLKIDL